MKSIFIAIIVFASCSSAFSQWRKIADLPGYAYGTTVDEPVTSVYFIDLPGPPRIGFAGTEVGLWKTTDGGSDWTKIWNGPSITQICFKDSLTGWVSAFDGSGSLAGVGCFRTSDGGESWSPIALSRDIFGSNAVYYKSNSNLLFLSTDSGMVLSKDLGDHWEWLTNIATGGISFFDDSNGIAAAFPDATNDTTSSLVRTTDGGLTWDSVVAPFSVQPLAILGTSICFTCDVASTIVSRSDDYGQTWRVLKDFHFMDTGSPYGNGMIGGNLSRLYIATDLGMYVSTDEGITWTLEPGSPPFQIDGWAGGEEMFYCAKGVTIAGATDVSGGRYDGAGLWEEIWPQSVVTQSSTAPEDVSIFPNPTPGPITIRGAAGAVEVTNVLGEQVLSSEYRVLSSEGATLDLSKLPAGTYYARIKTAGGIVMRKVVKE